MHKAITSYGILLLFASVALAQGGGSFQQKTFSCDDPTGILCAEVYQPIGYHGAYTGHDEPSVLFFVRSSAKTGSCTPNRLSAVRSTSFITWPATLIASPSLITGL